jgi:manganese transport protein
VPEDTGARLKTGWYLLGPAFVAAIAYVDPGNVAANISAGAQFGFALLWVIVLANVMAGLVQYLSAKLGLVTGRSLPEAIGGKLSRPARLAFWIQAEIVAMATDVAEVIGGAIALHILFRLPLLLGGVITGVVSLLLLRIQDQRGQQIFTARRCAGRVGAAIPRKGKRAVGRRHPGRDGYAACGLFALRAGPRPAWPS